MPAPLALLGLIGDLISYVYFLKMLGALREWAEGEKALEMDNLGFISSGGWSA